MNDRRCPPPRRCGASRRWYRRIASILGAANKTDRPGL